MITVAELAKDLNVSTSTVYRMLKSVEQSNAEPLIEKHKGTTYFTEEGEKVIREHLAPIERNDNQCSSTTIIDEQEENAEILFLREQVKELQDELSKEREFSRTQSEKITDLTDRVISQNEQLIKLNENQQILLLSEQTKNKPPLLSEITTDIEDAPHENKQGFFKRIFNKKNR